MTKNKLVILMLGLSLLAAFEVNAQTKKRNPKNRRATSTVTRTQPAPVPSEPEVVSRATDDLIETTDAANSRNNVVSPDLPARLPERPVKSALTAPAKKNNSAEDKENRFLLDLERLSVAETRAETFRKQLSDAIDREANLRTKIEQLDFQMRPENIQLETATTGSLRPEELREARRKMFENDKLRTADQLNKTLENRVRLELAVANADMLVDKLRSRVEAETAAETGRSADQILSKDSAEPTNPNN